MLDQQNDNGNNQDKGKERGVEFVIASKYPAKPFELLKEIFKAQQKKLCKSRQATVKGTGANRGTACAGHRLS